jgi:hypothetical protein
MHRLSRMGAAAVFVFGAFLFEGCGSEGDAGDDGGNVFGGGGGDGGVFGDAPVGGCTGLACKIDHCPNGGSTTVSGFVYTPAGNLALYGVTVYVPNAPLASIHVGVNACTACEPLSGAPVASPTLTDSAGHFVLKDVPTGDSIPLVVQIGKWRRQVTLPHVASCTDTKLDGAGVRLPGKQADGDMPQMAITTGKADPFECLLLKIGIDASEFTLASGTGRVHFYQSDAGNGSGKGRPLASAPTSTPHTDALAGSVETLKKHDVVIVPCEASDYPDYNAPWRSNMLAYLNAGGRTFFTHYQYTWMKNASGPAAPLATVAQFDVEEGDRSDKSGALATLVEDIYVDPSFPKGQIFADWLQNVQATTTLGKLPVNDWRHDVKAENHPPSQRWITADTHNGWPAGQAPSVAAATVPHFTYNTPMDQLPDKQCGKAVFSDFHVSGQEYKDGEDGSLPFPDECALKPLSPQEKALIFMLFDLNACVQDESKGSAPPPILR